MKPLIALILGLHLVSGLAAQELSKEERKRLQKEIKELQKNPERYKRMKEAMQEKKSQLVKLDAELADLDSAIKNTQIKVDEKEQRIKEISDEIARMNLEKRETETAIQTQTNEQGLVYKVQIPITDDALYQEVSELNGKKRPIFSGDTDPDGTKKYTMGYFKTKEEAETFRKYLQMLKIRDAQVVAYKDGKRVR